MNENQDLRSESLFVCVRFDLCFLTTFNCLLCYFENIPLSVLSNTKAKENKGALFYQSYLL